MTAINEMLQQPFSQAIGWALRDRARVDPDWVRGFVASHPDLSGLSRREALKHLGPLP